MSPRSRLLRSRIVRTLALVFTACLASWPAATGAQTCAVETRELFASEQPLGSARPSPTAAPIRLLRPDGPPWAVWIQATGRVGLARLDQPSAAPVQIDIPVASVIGLSPLVGGMLLVTHAPCTSRARTDCFFALALDDTGRPRGPLRRDRLPAAPRNLRAEVWGSDVAYGVVFERVNPWVLRYRAELDGSLSATTGGGSGRGRGRAWAPQALVRRGADVVFMAWEQIGDEASRTVIAQTGRRPVLELRGVEEERPPVGLRATPSGELEVVLRDDAGRLSAAAFAQDGRLAAAQDLPAERSTPVVPGGTQRVAYGPDHARVLFYADPAARADPIAEALLEPMRRRRPGVPAPLLTQAADDGAFALWVDQTDGGDVVRAARIRCAAR